jgi:hypothetical protein
VTLSLIWLMVNELTGTIQLWAHTTGFVLGGTTLTQFVLTVAAVAAVWFTPWWVTTALALAAAGSWLAWDTHLVLALHPAGLLVLLAALARGEHRLPRHWLVLAGALVIATALQGLASEPGLPFFQQPMGLVPAGLATLVAWGVFGLVVLWAVVDARPALAMAVCLVSNYLITALLAYVGLGFVMLAPWQVWLPATGAAVLTAGAIWRVRRQAVL